MYACMYVFGNCRSEFNETMVEVTGQYVAAIFDDVMPDYVTVGDGKNYSSNITNVSTSFSNLHITLLQRSVTSYFCARAEAANAWCVRSTEDTVTIVTVQFQFR